MQVDEQMAQRRKTLKKLEKEKKPLGKSSNSDTSMKIQTSDTKPDFLILINTKKFE
jgi:hypothetical protein